MFLFVEKDWNQKHCSPRTASNKLPNPTFVSGHTKRKLGVNYGSSFTIWTLLTVNIKAAHFSLVSSNAHRREHYRRVFTFTLSKKQFLSESSPPYHSISTLHGCKRSHLTSGTATTVVAILNRNPWNRKQVFQPLHYVTFSHLISIHTRISSVVHIHQTL